MWACSATLLTPPLLLLRLPPALPSSFLNRAICLFQADKDMDAAIRALRLRAYPTWALGRSLMIVTAVLYPVLMAAAAGG
jgi:hypothetical protein